jgi:small GTP-binding protein
VPNGFVFLFIGVGKTSLVAKYIGNYIYPKEIGPTIGASFFTCKINLNNVKVKMQLWDTGEGLRVICVQQNM